MMRFVVPSISNQGTPEPISSRRAIAESDAFRHCGPNITCPHLVDDRLSEPILKLLKWEAVADNAATENYAVEFYVKIFLYQMGNDKSPETVCHYGQ